jgi:putative oxidoreductase
MATAAYQHILTAGMNIYVLELVVLYLGGSLALLLNGPGRFSFDAGMGPELLAGFECNPTSKTSASDGTKLTGALTPAAIAVDGAPSSRLI